MFESLNDRLSSRRQGDLSTVVRLCLLLALLLAGASCRPSGDARAIDDEPPAADSTPQATANSIQAIATRVAERLAFATGTPDPATTTESAVAEGAKPLVTLDLGLTGALPNLDPGIARSQNQLDLGQSLFAGLTHYNHETNTIEPELATSWIVSPDGLTWTFKLRNDLFWVRPNRPLPGGSGLWSATPVRPVTADDVVFAVERACGHEVEHDLAYILFIIDGCRALFSNPAPMKEDRAGIGIKAIDATTLEVELTEPAGYFLTLTSLPFFQPVPRDLVTEEGVEWIDANGDLSKGWQTPNKLVASGPYFLVPAQTTMEQATLHRNPLWPIERLGNSDIVKVQFFQEELDAFKLWQGRKLDIAPLPASEREQFIAKTPAKVKTIPGQVLFYIGFNFDSQVFREPEVRRAFSAAIDRQQLVDEVYNGRGIVMRHVITPDIVAGLPPDEAGVGYSPDYARQQMAASTFRSCRLIPEITLLVSSADLSLLQAELLRDMWIKELDCLPESIHIEQVQFGTLLTATRPDASGRPDMWELAWSPAFPDAHNAITDLLHCRLSENRQHRECSEADALMQQAATTLDTAERATLYRRVASLFFNENGLFPVAPLYIPAREIVFRNDWITFTPAAFGGQQWDRIVVDAALKELEQER